MARLRVCSRPGCPTLSDKTRCDEHQAEYERARGTRQQRGYGKRHDRNRARLVREFIPGTPCPKCGGLMWNPDLLDAGHSVDLRDNPDAEADQLEHRGCNRGWRRGQ